MSYGLFNVSKMYRNVRRADYDAIKNEISV